MPEIISVTEAARNFSAMESLVVVEYNTRHGNSAVPYPLDDAAFLSLAARVGLTQPEIRIRAPSTFLGEMDTGVAFRPITD